MTNLTLKQLRYFEALVRHGHFGRAADACAISQPALSMQIKELEESLGTALFERGARQVQLTNFGKEFALRTRDILSSVDALGDLYIELFVESLADAIGRGFVVRCVHPSEADISSDQAAIACRLSCYAYSRSIQFFDAIAHADCGEFVAARVKGEGLENFGARVAKFAVQLEQSLGVFERHFRRKRAGANASALFEFKQVAAVAQHRAFVEFFENALFCCVFHSRAF